MNKMPDESEELPIFNVEVKTHVEIDEDFQKIIDKNTFQFHGRLIKLHNQHEATKIYTKKRKEKREAKKKKEQEAGQKKWDEMKAEQAKHRVEKHAEKIEEKEKDDGET